jgi:hypothetical protein
MSIPMFPFYSLRTVSSQVQMAIKNDINIFPNKKRTVTVQRYKTFIEETKAISKVHEGKKKCLLMNYLLATNATCARLSQQQPNQHINIITPPNRNLFALRGHSNATPDQADLEKAPKASTILPQHSAEDESEDVPRGAKESVSF